MLDNQLMFADGFALTGTAELLTTTGLQAIDTYPIQDALGRQLGVGGGLFVEVWGLADATGASAHTLTIKLYTDADLQMGSAVLLWSHASITGLTTANSYGLLAQFPLPIDGTYERYLALSFQPTVSPASLVTVKAGITMCPTSLRAYGSGMNFN